ncbi:MAG TPA: 50S ribosomal protein L17 [Tepidisphaeraceae bacterium]|nr:50S ribosomal protein L17 [Tepidisphaeraceae bacterium]
MSRHMIRGRQLSRDTEHRKALRRNMAQSLFEHGKIKTTPAKAKEVKAFVEKLITEARKNTLTSRRRVIALMQDRRLVDEEQEFTGQTVVQKLFADVAPKFGDRQGGYTRIIKLANYRIGDAGEQVLLQLCTEESAPKGTARRSAGLRRKRNERKHQFASRILKKGGKSADAGAATATGAGGEAAGEGAAPETQA